MPGYPVSSAFVLTTGLALVGILTIGSVPHATAQSATPSASPPPAASGDFAGLVDIGGRALYLECHGTGSPTVVLVAGSRSSARYWSDDLLHPEAPRRMVLPGVAEFTRVCAYDRPGTYAEINGEIIPSRSDAIPQPRTVPEIADELHALLQAAGVRGPYVLAGHSLGGFIARFYAATYPDEVVGLVLVDATPSCWRRVPPERWQALVRLNQGMGTDEVIPIPGYGDVETLRWGADNAVMREAVAASPLRPMPSVLAHGRPFPCQQSAGVHTAEWDALLRRRRGPGHPRPERAFLRGHRKRPRHPPGSTRAGDRSRPPGGRGRAQPGHLV
jgi:pimeloyl-ACP methyl ester carboxylesterase